MTDSLAMKRLRWACRRGMLELDLILEPYLNTRFPKVDSREQRQFMALLECNDQDLFDWFLGKKPCTESRFSEIIALVLQHAQSQT